MLLCIPERAVLQRRYRAVYAGLLGALPAATRFTVLTEAGAAETVRELGAGRDVTLVLAPEDLRFSVWAQDPYLAVSDLCADPPATCLVQPAVFRRDQDVEIAGVLAAATALRAHPSDLCFQGGHVLAGDEFVLVGRDCLDATIDDLATKWDVRAPAGVADAAFAASLFERVLGSDRRVLFVGTDLPVPEEEMRPLAGDPERVEIAYENTGGAQPLDHLDMFISLAGRGADGRYRLLVGSPALADEILGRPPVPQAMAALFDDVARGLDALGFAVIRNPLPVTHADGRRWIDGTPRQIRRWYFASANNCLVQIDPMAGDRVWLPTYGHEAWRELAATDAANRAIWEELGFAVHELPSCHVLAQSHGSVHCIVKELERLEAG